VLDWITKSPIRRSRVDADKLKAAIDEYAADFA
jgi:hypothetical protein